MFLLGPLLTANALLVPFAPAVIYGLRAGPAAPATPRDQAPDRPRQRLLAVTVVSLVLLLIADVLGGPVLGSERPLDGLLTLLVSSGTMLAVAVWILGMVDVIRQRRWAWVVVLPLATLIVASLSSLYAIGQASLSQLSSGSGFIMTLLFGVWPGIVTGLLVYGLWAGPVKPWMQAKPA